PTRACCRRPAARRWPTTAAPSACRSTPTAPTRWATSWPSTSLIPTGPAPAGGGRAGGTPPGRAPAGGARAGGGRAGGANDGTAPGSDGLRAQRRTAVLVASGAAAGLVTVLVGVAVAGDRGAGSLVELAIFALTLSLIWA